MIGITLTTDQIRSAPKEVRQWIEQQVIASLGVAAETPAPVPAQATHLAGLNEQEAGAVLAQVRGMLAAANVFLEFGRAGVVFGQPPVVTYRLIDILNHTRLQNIGQVMTCLEALDNAVAQLRGDANIRFCGFDNEGHCFIAPETQAAIAALWHDVIASEQGTSSAGPVVGFAPAA